jgi:Tol biopolymer transport system component
LLVGFALFAGGVVPRPAPVAGDIAFAHATYDPMHRVRPGDLAFFTVSSDGGSPTRLTGVPEEVPWPVSGLVGPAVRWSPDGSRIAFRLFHDEAGIWLMDRDGSNLHRLVELPLDQEPDLPFLDAVDWSPDGTRIAYTYPYDDVRSPLYVVDVEDGKVTNLTGLDPDRGVTRALAWSPDGSRLAFARTGTEQAHLDGGYDSLFVIDADGTGEVRLTSDGRVGNIRGLTWAPDGERIAFIWHSLQRLTLQVVDADGSAIRDLSRWSADGCCFWQSTDLRPMAWSPNGDRIAIVPQRGFAQQEGEPETIVLVRADGSGQNELAKGSYFDMSPDGSRFVVAEARLDEDPGPYAMYVMNIDGTDKRWVAEGEFPAWAPVPRE